jgi:glucose-6-phosphate isomerase
MTDTLQDAVSARLEAWTADRVAERLWARDGTLWAASGAAPSELTAWLGWLDLPERMAARQRELELLAANVAADGYRQVGVLGMGGSSLAPDLMAGLPGDLELRICDSTHPDAVRAFRAWANSRRTILCVSSKSGTTVEPLAFQATLAEDLPGLDFVAITDPGTPLANLAASQGFRAIVTGEPDVGGRYSALSVFGLVPAALHGVSVGPVIASAAAMAAACGASGPENPGIALGAFLVETAAAGRDKLTILTGPDLAVLGDWIEQLVAESLGKNGRGIVPIVGEGTDAIPDFGTDRSAVLIDGFGGDSAELSSAATVLADRGIPVCRLRVESAADLGAEFFRWEVATAVAAIELAVNPFDQPNVAEAKAATDAALASGGIALVPTADPEQVLAEVISLAAPGDYLAVLAFLPPTDPIHAALAQLRASLRRRSGVAVTVGIGPRYLHSTGQLHKGGPNRGVFLLITAEPDRDLPIDGQDRTFGQLIGGQAAGDLATLQRHGRRTGHIHLAGLTEGPGGLAAMMSTAN